MEGGWGWEQKTLISELIQGMECAKQLRVQLRMPSAPETKDLLVQKILASYEKALLILKWSGSSMTPQAQIVAAAAAAAATSASGLPESPISINGSSPRSDDFDKENAQDNNNKDVSKKRKLLPTWTDHVKISSDGGLEGPHDDGYSWRKYGQKDILGAKYPRSYYRCTYRNTQNCWATKQVQRSDEDPTSFEVTYRGKHTCSYGNQSVPPPASPEKQEKKTNNHDNNINTNNNYQPQHSSEQILLNLRQCVRFNTEELNNKEIPSTFAFPSTSFGYTKGESHSCFSALMLDNNNFKGSSLASPPYISPAEPDSNNFYHMNNFGGIHHAYHSESDLTEMISANNSATNSPIPDLDFSLDHSEIDPNFPFDTPEFFT